jgi:hypothetical protein
MPYSEVFVVSGTQQSVPEASTLLQWPLSVFLLYAHVLKINEGSIFIGGREGGRVVGDHVIFAP